MAPGQTGCLETGDYGSTSTVHRLTNSGTTNGQITITSAPGQTAKIIGLVELEASYTTLSSLEIDGSNNLYNSQRSGTNCPYPVSNGLEIDGHDDVFQYNDLYQSVPSLRGNGIGIGWNGQADRTIIRYNRIHDLGQCEDYDQMIYLAHGNDVQIYDNWLWNDPHGWGIQIYPTASHAHIYNNVIDDAGSGFVVGGASSVSGNMIDHNIVMNSTGLPRGGLPQGVGISDTWDSTPGTGNVFADNDLYDNPGGVASVSAVTLSANTTANPDLIDPQAHNYSVATQGTLASWKLWNGDVGQAATSAPTARIALDSRKRPAAERAGKHKRTRHQHTKHAR